MENVKSLSNSNFMEYLKKTISAESEEDLEYLYKALRPSNDREEMSEVYKEVLGYNPLTYFDHSDIEELYNEIVEMAPDSLRDSLIEDRNDIIQTTMDRKEKLHGEYLLSLLMLVIKEETGWVPKKYEDVYSVRSLMEEFDLPDDLDDDIYDEDEEDDEEDFLYMVDDEEDDEDEFD